MTPAFANNQIARAMAIMVAAMLFAPVMDAIAKTLAVKYAVSPATVTFGRFVVQSVFILGFSRICLESWRNAVLHLQGEYPAGNDHGPRSHAVFYSYQVHAVG